VELIQSHLGSFNNDPYIMLTMCYIYYHGLNKPWEALTNLMKVSEFSKQSRDLEYATYCFSKLIEQDFSNSDRRHQSVNDDHIPTEEIIAFEQDFERFLGLLMKGTLEQHKFWENLRSQTPEQDKFDKASR